MADFRDVPSSENDIYWITGGWAARLSTSLPHRDTHGPLLTCPAQSGQPQNRRLRRFDAARGEDDVEAGARRAEEDPARRLDELGRRRAQRRIANVSSLELPRSQSLLDGPRAVRHKRENLLGPETLADILTHGVSAH